MSFRMREMYQPRLRLARWLCECCGAVCTHSWWSITGEGVTRVVYLNLLCDGCSQYVNVKALHARKRVDFVARVMLSKEGYDGKVFNAGNGTANGVAKR